MSNGRRPRACPRPSAARSAWRRPGRSCHGRQAARTWTCCRPRWAGRCAEPTTPRTATWPRSCSTRSPMSPRRSAASPRRRWSASTVAGPATRGPPCSRPLPSSWPSSSACSASNGRPTTGATREPRPNSCSAPRRPAMSIRGLRCGWVSPPTGSTRTRTPARVSSTPSRRPATAGSSQARLRPSTHAGRSPPRSTTAAPPRCGTSVRRDRAVGSGTPASAVVASPWRSPRAGT